MSDQKASGWMVVVAVLVAVGTFGIATVALFFGDSVYSIGKVIYDLQEISGKSGEMVVDRLARPEVKVAVREASRAAREGARTNLKDRAEELRRAAWVDFDSERRDVLAVEVARAASAQPSARIQPGKLLLEVGALEALVSTQPSSRDSEWFVAAQMLGAWDRVRQLSSDHVNSKMGARTLCLAGDEAAGQAVYGRLIDAASDSSEKGNLVAEALACGGPDDLALTRLFRPSAAVASLAVSRDLEHVEPLYRRISAHKGARTSPARLGAAAALYVDDVIDSKTLVLNSVQTNFSCWNDSAALRLSAPPEVFHAALDKLAKSSDEGGDSQKTGVKRLYVAALMSGLSRLEDHRRDDIEITDSLDSPCVGLVELEFEPEAAVKRYRRLSEEVSERNRSQALSFLAVAHAHTGDYDAAFDAAIESSRDGLGRSRYGNAMSVALGHASGRLDELELVEPRDSLAATLKALRGTEEEREKVRLSGTRAFLPAPGPTLVYLAAALAPGHEEEFLRGFYDPNVSLSVALRRRANAARWRGDAEAEERWRAKRSELHARAQKGDARALHLVLSRR